MIFVDSVYPAYLTATPKSELSLPDNPIVKSAEELEAMKLKEKVEINMTHARMMARKWQLPRWEGVAVPPTILLRAKESVQAEPHAFVDYYRHSRTLGWERYMAEVGNFIKSVMDVEGHHFSLFEFDKVDIARSPSPPPLLHGTLNWERNGCDINGVIDPGHLGADSSSS